MSEDVEVMKEAMRDMLRDAKDQCAWMYESLSREAVTDGQGALAAKHGTPYEFGKAVVNALDMISPSEARAAIEKYAAEWRAA